MIRKLEPSQYPNLRPLLAEMAIHLPMAAILAGDVPGEWYADDPSHPRFALTWTGHRFYLAGSPPGEAGLAKIRQIFLDDYRPQAQALDKDLFYIHYPLGEKQNAWERAIDSLLDGRDPIKVMHQHYSREKDASQGLCPDWRAMLPEGFELRAVDAALLADERIKNPDFLTEEMLSERPSVQEFLHKSFGVCLLRNDEIIGWCLSEYNTGSRCEVGIATREDFRRRGFATLMTCAFIELAFSRGIVHIGWHCNGENLASGATALKAGFLKVTDYPIYLGWFDPAINLTQNGYFSLFQQRYPEALGFFERSFALGELPDWAYFGAACAAARSGKAEAAFSFLDQALAHGFRDVERLRRSEHLVGLHDQPAWEALVERLVTT